MKIELHEIPVRDVVAGYVDSAENGIVGYGGKLNIRPAFQREFIYKDKQRDEVMITIMVILISMATAIYFGKWIKTTLPINLLFLLLFVQLVYVGIRWYVKGWRETRGYH